MNLFRRRPVPTAKPKRGLLQRLRDFVSAPAPQADPIDAVRALALRSQPVGGAADSALKQRHEWGDEAAGANPVITGFFAGQAVPMPADTCAILAQHWLIDAACRMPARDAVRQGWVLSDLDEATEKRVRKADKALRLNEQLQQFVHLGRVFGWRVLLFKVRSPEQGYYEHPFNPDGVTPGSYQGIVQVDPQWVTPELDAAAIVEPASLQFYVPTYWLINGQRYHRSHLVIFRNGELPDLLKPMFKYGGISVPQRIVERVYSAERTANEAHQLAMTKRVSVWKTDLAEVEMGDGKVEANLRQWRHYLDNFGVKLADKEGDDFQQFDTSLADFDAVVMNGYQLVAAAAGVPATKLLGTTPKGFNATGEYEESAYHESLESIQTHDLSPVLDRHYQILARSMGLPALEIEHSWQPLDSPTAAEYATIEQTRATTDAQLVATGAIDAEDVRNRLRRDREGSYYGIEEGVLEDSGDGLV